MDMYDAKHLYDRLKVAEREDGILDLDARLRAMNGPLLTWYEEHARVLPWRENPEGYRVWISEIMLQQTRVEAVKPYFERFLEASVEDDRLMKLWEGLGYYNRARNLKKAAGIIMEEYGGVMPQQYEELLKLPGIGSYTAGAVASIAFGQPVPAVDGNVLRVISRVTASREDILKASTKKWMETHLKETMPGDRASHFNQGLIEIGAIVCVPNGKAKCEICPLAFLCEAYKKGIVDELPKKKVKKERRIEDRTILILKEGDRVGIRKRPSKGLLAGLYELPGLEGHLSEEEVLAQVKAWGYAPLRILPLTGAKHIFSHVEWHMTGYAISLEETENMDQEGLLFVDVKETEEHYPIPAAFAAYAEYLNISLGQEKYKEGK